MQKPLVIGSKSWEWEHRFNPLIHLGKKEFLAQEDTGIRFSPTLEEQIGGQLKVDFLLRDL